MIPTRWALSRSVRYSWMTVITVRIRRSVPQRRHGAVRDLVVDRVPGEEVLAELGELDAVAQAALARGLAERLRRRAT